MMDEYILGSFNMFKFSRQGSPEAGKSYETIAKIFQDAKFDIVSVQEAFDKKAVKDLVDVLNKKTRGKWDYSWDEPKRTTNKQAREGYAFIWNTKRIDKVATRLDDGTIREFHPRIVNQYRKDIISTGRKELLRNPYYGRFAPRNGRGESCDFELRMINAHIMFKKTGDDKDSFDLSDVAMRKNEYAILSQVILPKIDMKKYGKEDEDDQGVPSHLHAYTVLMGDYNLNIDNRMDNPLYANRYPYLSQSFIAWLPDGSKKHEIVTVQEEKTSLIRLPASPQDDEMFPCELHYSNNYDHFTYDKVKMDRYKTVVVAHRVNVIEENSEYGVNVKVSNEFNGDFRKYHDTVSDHLPVMMKLTVEPRRARV